MGSRANLHAARSSRSTTRCWLGVQVLLLLALASGAAQAQPQPALTATPQGSAVTQAPAASQAADTPQPAESLALFRSAAQALASGSFDSAIDQLELLADRGFVHPDVSFNRGVAYSRRAESSQGKPGDLGRAAAGFQECLRLRPGDSEAARALAAVEGQITRRRSREGRAPVVANASLRRAVVGLLDEDTWAWLGAFAALVASVGLGLRLWHRRENVRFSAGVSASVASVALVLFAWLAFAARHYRVTTSPAVVITTEARLLDVQGRPLPKSDQVELEAVPEGALVWIGERSGSLVRIEWGTTHGWVHAEQLQALADATAIAP